MAGNREVILADFQACTGIDDVGEALQLLEGTNWDLVAAVNRVIPQDMPQPTSEASPDIEMIEEIRNVRYDGPVHSIRSNPAQSSAMDVDVVEAIAPSTSRSKNTASSSRSLTFHINYQNKVYHINISETQTFGDLKKAIFRETRVSPCNQRLTNWKREPNGDSTVLQTLSLHKETSLNLSTLLDLGDTSTNNSQIEDRLLQTYKLNILDKTTGQRYSLNFPGTETVLGVKNNVYTLTNVPARNQRWKGWPTSLKDDNVMLAQSGISFPEHDLTVEKILREGRKEVVDLIDSDTSIEDQDDNDDFDDTPDSFNVEDDIFIDNIRPTKIQRLLPDNVEDEIIGTLHFAEQFEKRYGPAHPEFFAGTFEDAVKESCLKPAKERKLLAVYLHHDNSVLANVFCTQLLGCETVVQMLSANFVVWGWDFTHESNKRKFLASINRTLSPVAATAVRNVDVDVFPVLMIIMRSRSNTEIFTVIHGNIVVNELLTSLIQAVDVFQEQRRADIGVEEERHAREKVKEEQDQAYQESLDADRAKEKAKQMHEQREKEMREQADKERLAEEARKEANRQAVESILPPEPNADVFDGVTKIRVRLPAGKFLERRFQSNTPLQTLLNYLIAEGYPTEEYKVLSSWPRRDLTSLDTQLSLSDLKFHPQETVILEER